MGEDEERRFEEGKDEWKKGRRGSLRHIAREACVVHGISSAVAPQSANASASASTSASLTRRRLRVESGVTVPTTLQERGSAALGLKTA